MRACLLLCLALSACERSNSEHRSPDGSTDFAVSGGDGSMDLSGGDALVPGDGALGDGATGDGPGADLAPCVTDELCFTGSDPAKRNVGACRDGVRFCVNGALGQCQGEVLPASESCNGIDDDCDGNIDNGLGNITCGVGACAKSVAACVNGSPNTTACIAGTATGETCNDGIDQNCNGVADDGCSCVFVAPVGNDNGSCGSATLPCATIKYAIENIAGNGGANSVCVESAVGCSKSVARIVTTYVEGPITMKNGVSVLGGFDPAALPTPVPSPAPRSISCVTQISVANAGGVVFDATTTTATVLDGFEIVNTNSSDAVTAGVTVNGSIGAVISNNYILGGSGTAESDGVRISDSGGTAATPLLSHNAIVGGTAPTAIGISSKNSQPTVTGHCDTINGGTGRCTNVECNPVNGGQVGQGFIHARKAGGTVTTDAFGIVLDHSPGALIENNAVSTSNECPGSAPALNGGDAGGVFITGDASNAIVRGNFITGNQGTNNAVGVWADTCNGAGAALWIFDNQQISGSSPTSGCNGDGVRAVGDCHPRIDGNNLILGGEEGSSAPANGIHCVTPTGGTPSRCTVLRNTSIQGSQGGFPPTAAGVRCDDGACGRIEGNRINGNRGTKSFGIVLGATGVLVTTNFIDAGCAKGATPEAVGIEAVNSFSQIQNNLVRGNFCSNAGTSVANSWAVRVTAAGNEVDLDGNTLLAQGEPNGASACTSEALGLFDSGAVQSRGVFRNNILHAGFCANGYDVDEHSATALARVFTNNDLSPRASPSPGPAVLYYRSASLTPIAAVNAIFDPTGNSNISAEPQFTNPTTVIFPMPGAPDFHLQGTSPCINAGVAALGGPVTDWDFPGNLIWQSMSSPSTRTNTPDIGCDEAN